jgi:hypothetical protein
MWANDDFKRLTPAPDNGRLGLAAMGHSPPAFFNMIDL